MDSITTAGMRGTSWNRSQAPASQPVSNMTRSGDVSARQSTVPRRSFLYDGINPVQELSQGLPTANMLCGLRPDEYFARIDTAGTTAFLTDALGSTLALVDGTGTVQTEYTYEPFGTVSASGTTNANSFLYTGREHDGTGLYYYRSRYYNPALQRFISEDQLGRTRAGNLFAYAGNNPMRYTDPLGLDKQTREDDL